jgi:hypothetical protein
MNVVLGRLIVMSCLLLGGALTSSYAQEKTGNAKILGITFDRTNLPGEVRGSAAEKELNNDWYMVEVKFSTEEDAAQVQVRFYVEGVQDMFSEEAKAAKGGGKQQGAYPVLVGDQTYLNVPKGSEHYAAMFLDPMTMIRYGGKDGARAFKQLNVHVQISTGSDADAEKDLKQERPEDAKWFEQGQQVSGALIGLKDSPWWPSQAKRYNRIKSNN